MDLDKEETEETRKFNNVNTVIARKYVEENYIHKDKIRKKIEYYKTIGNAVGVLILKKLLEE